MYFFFGKERARKRGEKKEEGRKIAGLTRNGKRDERGENFSERGGERCSLEGWNWRRRGGKKHRQKWHQQVPDRRGSFVKRTAIVAECSREMFCNSPRSVCIGCFAFEDPLLALMPRSLPLPLILINPPMTFGRGRIVIRTGRTGWIVARIIWIRETSLFSFFFFFCSFFFVSNTTCFSPFMTRFENKLQFKYSLIWY